jgi:Amt family ammonium transporter
LTAQIIGNGIITFATFAVAMGLMALVNLTGTLRVSKEGELQGLDIHEHGIPAYPEYLITEAGTPLGAPEPKSGVASLSGSSPYSQ